MRPRRFMGKLGLTLAITLIFLTVQLVPKPTRSAFAQGPAAAPLPVPEDPLGQQPEQDLPEISVNVDVRDGHLVVRVVDVWGPGRTPLVYRSWTNASASASGLGYWHLNHDLDAPGREPDGNITTYKYSHTTWNANQTEKWDVYYDDIGTYTTLQLHSVGCVAESHDPEGPPGPQGAQSAPSTRPTPRLAPTPRPGPTPRPRTSSAVSDPVAAELPPDRIPLAVMAQQVDQSDAHLEDLIATHIVNCTPAESMLYLPKGATRRYIRTTFVDNPLQEVRDANGNVTTYTYTSYADQIRPYIWKVRDPVGREVTYGHEPWFQECVSYNPENEICYQWKTHYRVRSVTDPYGRTVTYAFDGAGYLVSSTNNATGRTTTYTYGIYGLLASVISPRGYATSFQWGAYPNVTSSYVTRVTAADGTATNYAYTFATGGQQITRTIVTDARGYATTHDLYAGETPEYMGNVERVTTPLGHVTQYAYDARHNVTQVTDPRGHRTTYAYNSRNKVTQIVRAAGSLNLTTTLTWDGNDNLLSVTNPRGIRADYAYNAQHNLTSVRKAVGTADEALTQYTYTAWGGMASVIDPRNNTTTYTYTARRQVQTISPPAGGATSFTYNTFDDQVTRIDGNGRTWTTAYDASRLVTSVTDPLSNQIRHTYDANGNRVSTIDAKNQTTTFTYDNRDRLIRITSPLNDQTNYAYDAVSNLTQITNARGFSTVFTYDAANRLTQVRDALNQVTTSGYDAAGNRTGLTDRKGQAHAFTYDPVNRLTQVSAGGQTITSTYDANGNRLTMVDATGTTGYLYDSLDRPTRVTYGDGKTVQTSYDRSGNRTSLINPGNITTTYAYDGANRLTQMSQGALAWTFSYDGAGNRTRLTHANGTSIDYAYLNNHWLSSIIHKSPGGAVLQSFAYTYDANGNRLTQADSTGTTTFTYDALNRLTQAAHPGSFGTWSWTYDAVGNRTQQTAPPGAVLPGVGSIPQVITYTYDGNNRLTQANTTTYSYDANGNLTGISAGQTFAWDVFNRLTQTTGPGGAVTYTYNGDGLKLRRVGPDGTTNYYHDGIRPIWETNASGQLTNQYDRDIFGNLLSRRDNASVRWYYHHDGLGSTSALTNSTGSVVATMLHDAWGNIRTTSGSSLGNYRFTGAERDTTTGLYHMGARFYDPVVGRWLSEDPVQDKPFEPATLNFYTYVYNSPLGLVDPDGKIAILATAAIGAAIGLAAYALATDGHMTLSGAALAMGVGALTGAGLGALAARAAVGVAAARGASGTVLAEILRRNGGGTDVLGWVTGKGGQLTAWLEKGTSKAGFDHIVGKHLKDFIGAFGKLSIEELKELILQAAAKAQGTGAQIVQVTHNGITHAVKIVIGDNGYIVTAYPY